jgi:hypothetical protein
MKGIKATLLFEVSYEAFVPLLGDRIHQLKN